MYVGNPAEWGIKRTCRSCAARFYDLRRSPAVCPKCQTEYVEPVAKVRSHSSGAKSAPGRRSGASPFAQGPWTRRSGSHSPFAEARPASDDAAEGKVADDGDVEEEIVEEKDADAAESEGDAVEADGEAVVSEGEDEQSR